jgi:hypothetical protein
MVFLLVGFSIKTSIRTVITWLHVPVGLDCRALFPVAKKKLQSFDQLLT